MERGSRFDQYKYPNVTGKGPDAAACYSCMSLTSCRAAVYIASVLGDISLDDVQRAARLRDVVNEAVEGGCINGHQFIDDLNL